MEIIREPFVAGMFYPRSSEKLKEEIEYYLQTAHNDEEFENIFGIISPHAGYTYSGKTAAHAYKTLINKNYKRVVVISPSHREYFPGISIYGGDGYKTPLGTVPVDKLFSAQLIEGAKSIFIGDQGHRQEHALEVQLPFLQTVLKDFQIVPVVLGDQRKPFIDELAEKISRLADEQTLIVASSDLSHFYTKTEAARLDGLIEKRISEFDFEGLENDLHDSKCEACGGGGMVALLKAAWMKNKRKVKVLSQN